MNEIKTRILIAIVAFMAGFAVYDIFFVDLYLTDETKEATGQIEEVICPTRSSFPLVWDRWTDSFIAENPGAGSEAQLREWKDLMIGIG